MKPTPRTDAILADDTGDSSLIRYLATLARTLETDIAELNDRLIDRQNTLMEWIIENRNLKRELAKAENKLNRACSKCGGE